MSEEQKLCQSAHTEFVSGNYNASLQALSQLMVQRPNDHKVLHNKAVVEFFNSNHKNIDLFQKNLNYFYSLNNININDSEAPEDVEFCIIYYNQAIVYYLQKQYEFALKIMEKAFTLIQPMEESLAHKVCLFLLELHLCLNRTEKALMLISFIESQFISRDTHTNIVKQDKDSNDKSATFDSATDAFRIKLLHYRARCHLMNKVYDMSQKDLEVIYSAGKQNYSAIMMKSQIEFLKGNYEKASEIITVIQEDIEQFYSLSEVRTFIFYNNMGSIYHYLHKPAMAKYYVANKASTVCIHALEKLSKCDLRERPVVLQPSMVARFKYNVGVALLFAGKPKEAFDYFTEASQLMHTMPLVWLRLAECCIHLFTMSNEDSFDFQRQRQNLVNGTVGTGASRKILLNNNIYKNSAYSCESQSFAIPSPSLDFATLCLRNAQCLLPKGNSKLRMAVYTASAYVNLTIGNPVEALRDCVCINEDENASDVYKYLSRMYMAEALLLLDRISEAIEILNPAHYKDCDPCQEHLLSQWYPKNKSSAHTVLQYNMAVVLAIRGELEKSADLLKRIWVSRGPKSDVPIHVISLALYIELVLGHVDIVRTIIQQNCPQIFL